MKIRWRFGIAFLIIAGLVGGSLIFPAIALNAFINPITRGLWMIFRLFRMVDQQIYWGLLAIVVLAFSLLILPRGAAKPSAPPTPAPPRPKDAVAEWEQLLKGAAQSGENRRALEYRLNALNRKVDELVANQGVDEFVLASGRDRKRRSGAARGPATGWKLRRSPDYAENLSPFLAEMETTLEVCNDDDSDESLEHR